MSKLVRCKKCGCRFVVAELGRTKVSKAEESSLCGTCFWNSAKPYEIYELKQYAKRLDKRARKRWKSSQPELHALEEVNINQLT